MKAVTAYILVSIIVVIFLVIFYYYMDWVIIQYDKFAKEEIPKLPKYIPPIWINDAWYPTWRFVQQTRAKLAI